MLKNALLWRVVRFDLVAQNPYPAVDDICWVITVIRQATGKRLTNRVPELSLV